MKDLERTPFFEPSKQLAAIKRHKTDIINYFKGVKTVEIWNNQRRLLKKYLQINAPEDVLMVLGYVDGPFHKSWLKRRNK